MRWPPRTPRASSIATSSRPTLMLTTCGPGQGARLRHCEDRNGRDLHAVDAGRAAPSAQPRTCRRSRQKANAADARADLWSLGVVTYEMLTGRTPFEGTNTLAVIHAVLTVTPQPIRARRPDVPARAADVVDRTLVRDREERTITAREVQQLAGACHARLTSGEQPIATETPADLAARIGAALVALAIACVCRWLVAPPQRERAMGARKGAPRDYQARRQRPVRGCIRSRAAGTSVHPQRSASLGTAPEVTNRASIASDPAGANVSIVHTHERRGMEATGADAAQGRERAAGC